MNPKNQLIRWIPAVLALLNVSFPYFLPDAWQDPVRLIIIGMLLGCVPFVILLPNPTTGLPRLRGEKIFFLFWWLLLFAFTLYGVHLRIEGAAIEAEIQADRRLP